MKLFLLLFIPFGLVWLWTKNRNRAFRWLGFGVILTVQIFSLMPVGAIVFALYASPEAESAAAGNNYALGKIYSNFRVTGGAMHGLNGWEGVDISGGCGSPIYAPFSGKVTFKGLDGYNHVDDRGVVYDQNTMLTIQGDNGYSLTLLHGDYRVQHGDTIIQGDLLGYESSIGWSTGCHSHVILKDQNGRRLNFLDWQNNQEKLIEVNTNEYQHKTGQIIEGSLSAYDKEPTDQTIKNRQQWGQIPNDLSNFDAYIAVLDCNRIGQTGILKTISGNLKVLIFDCAGIQDGGAEWMINNNYVAELDYYSRIKYAEIVSTKATLVFDNE